MDLVRELRLRQWARQHYIPIEERQTGWHPVVLEEMRRRDIELFGDSDQVLPLTKSHSTDPKTSAVDLAPENPILNPEQVQFCQQPWGWTFAPRDSNQQWEIHGESSEIPRPHARKFFGNLPRHDEVTYLFVMD